MRGVAPGVYFPRNRSAFAQVNYRDASAREGVDHVTRRDADGFAHRKDRIGVLFIVSGTDAAG